MTDCREQQLACIKNFIVRGGSPSAGNLNLMLSDVEVVTALENAYNTTDPTLCPLIESYFNDQDTDKDGYITPDDCNEGDPDINVCSAFHICYQETCVIIPENCTNNIDDNGNGAVDCDDNICSSDIACNEICNNGIDDNGDTLVDCADPKCSTRAVCQIGTGIQVNLATIPTALKLTNIRAVGTARSILAGVGDFNNDTKPDFMLGRSVIFGGSSITSPTSLVLSPDALGSSKRDVFLTASEITGNSLGSTTAVTSIGDFNGDGIPDVAFIATNAYIIFGSSSLSYPFNIDNISGTDGIVINQDPSTPPLLSLSSGDINGDGYRDLILGADNFANSFPVNGYVYVIFGGSNVASPISLASLGSAGVVITGARRLGGNVGSGDINNDGYDEILSSADAGPFIPSTSTNSTVGYMIFGNAELPQTIDVNNLSIEEGVSINILSTTYSPFGTAPTVYLSILRDLNHDEYNDLVISTQSTPTPSSMYSFIVFGKQSFTDNIYLGAFNGTVGVDGNNGLILRGPGGPSTYLGDIENDGRKYFSIGTQDGSVSSKSAGFIISLPKSQNNFLNNVQLNTCAIAGSCQGGYNTIFFNDSSAPNPGTHFQYSVSNIGDFDNGGKDDLIIGTARTVSGVNGHAYVLYGEHDYIN